MTEAIRFIPVLTCAQCPHYDRGRCMYAVPPREVPYPAFIPDWCPLDRAVLSEASLTEIKYNCGMRDRGYGASGDYSLVRDNI